MTKALITGCDGFMASHLADHLLEKGYEVIGLIRPSPIKNLHHLKNNPKFKPVIGHMLDYFSVQRATREIDYVFHGAAISGISDTRQLIEKSWDVNTKGTMNVIKAAIENKVKRILYVSTCHIYGPQPSFLIKEEAIPIPVDIYAASKASSEYVCKALMNMYNELDLVISRGFNHYGERQREDYLVPRIITQALHSNKIELGAADTTRDFTYIGDIVEGYISIMEKGRKGEVYNICSGVEKTVRQITKEITELMGFNGEIIFSEARKADMQRSVGSYNKAKTELGWEPKISWEDGLLRTIDFYLGKKS